MRLQSFERGHKAAVIQPKAAAGQRKQTLCKRLSLKRCIAETASIPSEEVTAGNDTGLKAVALSPAPSRATTPERPDDGVLELDSVLEREMLTDNGKASIAVVLSMGR
jgi:hypothetical protein